MRSEILSDRFMRDSDKLFDAVAQHAVKEGFHIVPLDQIDVSGIKATWTDLMEYWQSAGYGRVITEDDGYQSRASFALSETGITRGKKLRALVRRRSLRLRLVRNAIPLIGTVAAIAAAIAAALSAYFSYLDLSTR